MLHENWRVHKKDLNTPDNHDGLITHLQPDILECKVKWALGIITMNKHCGGEGLPAELFQILKDDAVKIYSILQQIWKTQQWQQDWKKISFHSKPKERQLHRMLKLPHNCTHLTHQQSNAQHSPSQTVREPWTSRLWRRLCVRGYSLSCVRLFATLWTVTHQAPLPMGFLMQEYWSG